MKLNRRHENIVVIGGHILDFALLPFFSTLQQVQFLPFEAKMEPAAFF